MLCVLYPNDFDIKSIQKCPIDFECKFAPLDDKENIGELGPTSPYVILQKDYFIANIAGREIKCDYNCRNRVMSALSAYRFDPDLVDDIDTIDNNFGLELINSIVHNNELPLMIFSNESLPGFPKYYTNSIMEKYTSVDIQKFAEITKLKPCNHDAFLVHFVEENVQDRKRKSCFNNRFLCCDMKTLETYEYSWEVREIITKKLKDGIHGCIAKWKAEDEALKLRTHPKRTSDFHLLDSEGHPVEQNTDYHLQMYDKSEDVLKILDCEPVIYATYRLNRADKIVVRYAIVDGIHYLTRGDQFLQVNESDSELVFADEIPEKEKRLEFHVTEINTFKTVQWDKDIWLAFQRQSLNYSYVTFNDEEIVVRWGKPLELLLKRV
ncbi:unnamed protein product [Umbelopsis ramanniana]